MQPSCSIKNKTLPLPSDKTLTPQQNMRSYADYVGILSSALCLIHCLIAPILLSLWLQIDTEHLVWIDIVFFGVSLVAVWQTARQTALPLVRHLLWGGVSMLGVSLWLEHWSEVFGYVAIVAMMLLIAAHLINVWYCRKCKHWTIHSS